MPLPDFLLRRLGARLREPGAGWLWVLATVGVLLLALWPAAASPVSPR